MSSRRSFLIMMGGGALLAVGAAAGAGALLSGDDAPASPFPTIHYGEEPCSHCGMIIDDPRFAAGWMEPRGDEQHFDDIACMILASADHAPAGETRFFVHDYLTEAWLDAGAAAYAVAQAIRSPMASGVAALPDRAQAEELARRHSGEVVAWHDLPHHLPTGHTAGVEHHS